MTGTALKSSSKTVVLATYATGNPFTIATNVSIIAASGDGIDGDASKSWTLTNAGVVKGASGASVTGVQLTGGHGGIGIDLLSASTVTNSGTVDGGNGGNSTGAYAIGGAGGDGVDFSKGGTFTNSGAVAAGAGGGASGAEAHGGAGGTGVVMTGGMLTNTGTISGGAGGQAAGAGQVNGAAGSGVLLSGGGTLVDSGTIRGGGSGDAVKFGTGTNLLIVDAGAVFSGAIDGSGGGTNTVDLTKTATAGTIGNIQGVQVVALDDGASWTIGSSRVATVALDTGATATLSSSTTVGGSTTNVAAGIAVNTTGTVVNDGTVAHAAYGLVAAGALTLTNGAGGSITGATYGVAAASGTVTNLAGGTITGARGVGMGNTSAASSIVVNAGTIKGTTTDGIAFTGTGNNTVTNSGLISGVTKAIEFGDGNDKLIVDPGAVFVGAVGGAGGTNSIELATGGAGTLTGLGTLFTQFQTVTVDKGATWTLAGSSVVAAGTTLTDSGAVTITGTGSLTGTIAGTGSLVFGGGHETFNAGAKLTVASWSLSGSALAGVAEALAYAGTVTEGKAAIGVGVGETLTLTGKGSSFAGTIQGGGTLAFTAGTDVFNTGASLVVSHLTIGGTATVSLGASLSYAGIIAQTTGILNVAANTLTLTSGASSFAGKIIGGGTFALTGGNQTFAAGALLQVAHWSIAAANVKVNENLTYAGTFTEKAGSAITIGTGDTLTLSGSAAFAGPISGAGTLAFTGGAKTLTYGALTMAQWSITGATAAAVNTTVIYAGKFTEAGTAAITVATGDTLFLEGTSTIGATVTGAGSLTMKGGTATIASGGKITSASWLVTAKASVAVNENLTFAGAFQDDAQTTVTIAAGDTLTLNGAVRGTGTIALGAGSTLDTGSTVLSPQIIDFSAGNGTLGIGDAAGFHGELTAFGSGDRIDVAGFAFGSGETAKFVENGAGTQGALTVKDGSSTLAFVLFGQYATAGFSLASDGHGGTLITYTPAAAAQPMQLAPAHH